MHLNDLDTPAAWIDLEVMERNLARLAGYTRAHGLVLRPHIKTHKVPALARRQVELGAAGITSAKVSEALVMARAGLSDILLAYPVWGALKWERLRELSLLSSLSLATDSAAHAAAVADALGADRSRVKLLVEVDAGFGRCGLSVDDSLTEQVARIAGCGMEVSGIMFYPGHLKHLESGSLDHLNRILGRAVEAFRRAGVEPRVVSGGSTPTWAHSHLVEAQTEIRPGTYIFNDCNTVDTGACGWEDCALRVRCRVVSTAVPGRAIVDGGSKTFSDAARREGGGFGRLVQAPEVLCEKMNEEHGYLNLDGSDFHPRPGDMVDVIPNHVCTTVNMHHTLYGVRGGEVVDSWEVAARGLIQ
ncbi:alanine racemase [bacterium]|nr:alanine racemase [bacterium]